MNDDDKKPEENKAPDASDSEQSSGDKVIQFSDLRKRARNGNMGSGHTYSNSAERKQRNPWAKLDGSTQGTQNAYPPQMKAAHPPMINLPPMVKALCALNLGIFIFMLLPFAPSKADLFYQFGFVPFFFKHFFDFSMSWQNYLSPLTHMFLHSGWLHIGMNMAMLAAFGAGVEKAYGAQRFLAFYLLCGLCGAAVHLLFYYDSVSPMVGASGAISGLFAAVLIVLQRAGQLPNTKYGIMPFIALWIGISVVFAFMGGAAGAGNIAWTAHIGGFLGGFALMRLKSFKF